MAIQDKNRYEILEYLEKGNYSLDVLLEALTLRGAEQDALFELARNKRDQKFPDKAVEVRSVIEISNECKQKCRYCNMGKNKSIKEYTIDELTMIRLMEYIYQKGRRVILIQSGENNNQKFIDQVSRCVEKIKDRHEDLIIILCLGDLSKEQFMQLRKVGADRYLLKFETSNPVVFGNAKPNDTLQNRLRCLDDILDVGFAAGSGNIVGLPGQTLTDVANDLFLLHRYNLSMNSATVFIPAENSEYKDEPYGDVERTLNTMALMRIMNPHRLMPTTSSLEKAQKNGQLRGLMAGANTVTLHDGTPEELKPYFPIYSINRISPQKEDFKEMVGKAHMKLS